MSTPEAGSMEHEQQPSREKERIGKFKIEFPDGSIGVFDSQMEAAEALKDWREAA